MKGLIINHDTAYIDSLRELFPDSDVLRHKEFNDAKADPYGYIILSGGPIDISKPCDLENEKEFLRSTTKPVLGICLGLELLCVMYGSRLLEFEKRRMGFYAIELFGQKYHVYHNHGCYISHAPEEFDVLFKNEDVIEAVMHKTKPVFALQGHPELSGNDGIRLRDLFFKMIVNKKSCINI